MKLNASEIEQLNQFENLLTFEATWQFKKFINCEARIIALLTGNQAGKTASVALSYVLRCLGLHPVAKKNVVYWKCDNGHAFAWKKLPTPNEDGVIHCPDCGKELAQHKRGSRVFRFASETLPNQSAIVNKEGESAEVKNTQYPEFKKWLPKFLVKKDITFRNATMSVRDIFGGADILIEFVSYNQSVQAMAGTQRCSCWLDEEGSMDFIEEQQPRLLAENGDMVYTLTPANRITHMYDEVYEKAAVYFRTKTIADKFGLQQIEFTESPYDIAVIQAATDDNPTLEPQVIEDLFKHVDDPDTLAIRRYGIFKQISGRIFKGFDWQIHFIKKDYYFPSGMPRDWVHGRGIDYHEHVKWGFNCASLSDKNELFIWAEANPDPETEITKDIMQDICNIGSNLKFRLNLTDPLATKTQTNTGTSTQDDMNYITKVLKKEDIGQGGYWESWDTRSTRGREQIRMRLKNAAIFKRPFNNKVVKDGKEIYEPTMWILDTCKITAKSFKNWRLEEWANNAALTTKEKKESPQQKWSHHPMVIEALLKDARFRPRKRINLPKKPDIPYYKGRRVRHASI